jgi:hypothetical protein
LQDENVLIAGRHQSYRRYYEKELGAGVGPSMSGTEHFGYTEPFRRFVERASFSPQANEIPNTAPSWLPDDDYYTNFHVGDPFIKVDEGYARLPGAGYAAIHPELEGVNPEDYPDIHKLAILADVAPYSCEYHNARQRVGQQAQGDTELEIEYEKIMNRVKQTRESVIRMKGRHFTSPVDEISGTVDAVSPGGITLNVGLSVLPDTKHLARTRRKPPLLTGPPSLASPFPPRKRHVHRLDACCELPLFQLCIADGVFCSREVGMGPFLNGFSDQYLGGCRV